MKEIFTIGYTAFQFNDFISVLKKYNVNSVIDVRSSPYSKFHSEYNTDKLSEELKKRSFAYRNYKNEFGARQLEIKYYPHGYMDFSLFVKSDAFRSGMEKIMNASEMGYRFVLMCAEKDPVTCHRVIMVAHEFYKQGYTVKNILANGGFCTQEDIECRLVDMYYPDRNQLSFFDEQLSWDEMVKNSYAYQNEKIGYRINGGNDSEDDDFE